MSLKGQKMLSDDVDVGDGPLDTSPNTVSFPLVSEEMIASIALGMEDELIVASRHGLSVEQYHELASTPWFQLQVQVKRSEFTKNGVTFKAKAGWMASDLLDQVYVAAAGAGASLGQKHDVLKTLIRAAGLEAKDDRSTSSAPTFQISIDLGEGKSVSLSNGSRYAPPAIDVESKEMDES